MAKPPIKAHKFTEGSKTYVIKLRDVYDTTGYTVGSAFGISKLPADYEQDDNDDSLSVSEGMLNGTIMKIRISYKDAQGKTKTARLTVPVSKVKIGLDAVLNKTYNAREVSTAGIPRRRRLG